MASPIPSFDNQLSRPDSKFFPGRKDVSEKRFEIEHQVLSHSPSNILFEN